MIGMKRCVCLAILLVVVTTIVGETTSIKSKLTPLLDKINVATTALQIVAIALAGLLLVGCGIYYMTAGNDEKKIEVAKKWARAIVIGLVIVLLATTITKVVVSLFG